MSKLTEISMECDLLELYRDQDRLDELEYIQMENKQYYAKCNSVSIMYLSDHDIRSDDEDESNNSKNNNNYSKLVLNNNTCKKQKLQ